MRTAQKHISWERYAAEFAEVGAPVPELARIGKRMRVLYEEVAQEPIPDNLLFLLKRLEKPSA